MESQIFTLPTEIFDVRLLPEGSRAMGTQAFKEAVGAFFEKEFAGFGGRAEVVVRDGTVTVSWQTDQIQKQPLQIIIEKLQRGERAQGVQLLKLLLIKDPHDVSVLYNLALALSEDGNIDAAESHLRRVVELAPMFVNGLAALGTILTRQQKNEESKTFLQLAAHLEPKNGWVIRNLAVVAMKLGRNEEAVGYFREAVTLDLSDQSSWLGLGDALSKVGDKKRAEEAYRHAIALNSDNDVAEGARAGLVRIAEGDFKAKAVSGLRPDAVEYCAAAMKRFSSMSEDDLRKLTLEIGMLGRSGLDVHSPERRYHLNSIPGDFSGLQLVCYMYVALKKIAPDSDLGFDLSKEYEAAKAA